MKSTLVSSVLCVMVGLTCAAPGLFYAAFPAPSSDTKVFRDFLGNQATSYAYQDGHSSAVSLSRSDVSKHLVAAPVPVAVPAPVEYAAPAPVAYAAPQVYHHAVAPVFTSSSYQYNHRYPGYTAYAAAPAYYY